MTLREALQGGTGVGEPRRVVVGRHAVLGHEDGYARMFGGQSDRVAERLGVDLPPGLHGGNSLWYWELAVCSDAGPGVRLHADEVVLGRDVQPVCLAQPARLEPPFLPALRGLEVDEGQGPSHPYASVRRLDRLHGQAVRVGHLLEVGRHDPHPVARRVVASDSTLFLLDGLGRRRSISRTHGQDARYSASSP